MPGAAGGATEDKGAEVDGKIKAQGDKVRQLKADKAAKPDIEEAVKKLLALKAEFKSATGMDWKPGMAVPDTAKTAPAPAASESNSSGMFSIV